MDSELEELFRRNQTNLTHIKQEIAVMKGEQSTSLIDEAPTPVKAPQERDPDVDTPMVRRPVRSTVPRPGTSEGRRLKCLRLLWSGGEDAVRRRYSARRSG